MILIVTSRSTYWGPPWLSVFLKAPTWRNQSGIEGKRKREKDTVQTSHSKAISPSFVAPLEDTSRLRFRLERAVLALEYASNWTSAESDLQSAANLVIEQNWGKSAC